VTPPPKALARILRFPQCQVNKGGKLASDRKVLLPQKRHITDGFWV